MQESEDAANTIDQTVETVCLNLPPTERNTDNGTLQCAVNVINEVADKHELGEKWLQTRFLLRIYNFQLTQCGPNPR